MLVKFKGRTTRRKKRKISSLGSQIVPLAVERVAKALEGPL